MKLKSISKAPWIAGFLTVATAAVVLSAPAFAQASVSRQQADQIALQTIPGSTLVHTSADHMKGAPVWDIHVSQNRQVWDVKVSELSGAIVFKKLSNEQPSSFTSSSSSGGASLDHSSQSKSSDAQDALDHQSLSSAIPSSGGVVFGQKTTSVPSAYQSYVNQALSKVGGTLKWVKFSHKDSTEIQMNIKIRKTSGGTTKVNDVFNTSGQLISQRIPSDN